MRPVPVVLFAAAAMGAVALSGVLRDAPPAAPQPIAASFPAGEDFDFAPPKPGSYRLDVIKDAPAGLLLDHEGRERSLADIFGGKTTLVAFVYFTCTDVNGCPFVLSTLFDIHERSLGIAPLRDHVQLATISFDPDRDTVEAIKAFRYPVSMDKDAENKIPWLVLTGRDRDAIQPVIDGFGQAISRKADTISHLLRLYLIDRKGRIRNVYGLGLIDPRLLMTDVETLLIEDGLASSPGS